MIWPFNKRKAVAKPTKLEQIVNEFSGHPNLLNTALIGEFNRKEAMYSSNHFLENEKSETAVAIFDSFAASGFYKGLSTIVHSSYGKFSELIARVKDTMSETQLDVLATELFGHGGLERDELIEFININPELFARNSKVTRRVETHYRRISAIKAASVLKNTDMLAQIFTDIRENWRRYEDEYGMKAFIESIIDFKRYNNFYAMIRAEKEKSKQAALNEEWKDMENRLIRAIDNLVPADLQKEVFKKSAEVFLVPKRHNTDTHADFGLATEYAFKSKDYDTITKLYNHAVSAKAYKFAFRLAESIFSDSVHEEKGKLKLNELLSLDESYLDSKTGAISAAKITGNYKALAERFVKNFKHDCEYDCYRKEAKEVFDVLCENYEESGIDKRDIAIMLNKIIEEKPSELGHAIAMAELLIHSDNERRTYDIYFEGVEKAIIENIKLGGRENLENAREATKYAKKYDVNFSRNQNMVKLCASLEKGVLAA